MNESGKQRKKICLMTDQPSSLLSSPLILPQVPFFHAHTNGHTSKKRTYSFSLVETHTQPFFSSDPQTLAASPSLSFSIMLCDCLHFLQNIHQERKKRKVEREGRLTSRLNQQTGGGERE
mmetsp:Transcript_13935/g.27847  ORF Transcript_13935/g.27847 Transcript_13935/m.27847 type:complete len:120 (+) Transcript_13935:212-571(+)